MTSDRFAAALAAIDSLHRQDPRRETVGGAELPAELMYAQRLTAWLEKLAPDADEIVRLAVRGQHLRRWQLPRDAYPLDRVGYLQWRTELKNLHADELGEILRAAGYDNDAIRRAQSLVKKERLKQDAEPQLLEDAVCLVFLEFEFSDFAVNHEREKLIGIVQKTWGKMSERGRQFALQLKLSPPCAELVQAALAAPPAAS